MRTRKKEGFDHLAKALPSLRPNTLRDGSGVDRWETEMEPRRVHSDRMGVGLCTESIPLAADQSLDHAYHYPGCGRGEVRQCRLA